MPRRADIKLNKSPAIKELIIDSMARGLSQPATAKRIYRLLHYDISHQRVQQLQQEYLKSSVIRDYLERRKAEIATRWAWITLQSLGNITPEKLESSSAAALATIAGIGTDKLGNLTQVPITVNQYNFSGSTNIEIIQQAQRAGIDVSNIEGQDLSRCLRIRDITPENTVTRKGEMTE